MRRNFATKANPKIAWAAFSSGGKAGLGPKGTRGLLVVVLAAGALPLMAENAAAAAPVTCFTAPSLATCATFVPATPGFTAQINSLSFNTQNTITTVILPGVTLVAPGAGPLQNQLTQALAGPNGALLLNSLGGVSGPPIFTFIGRQLTATNVNFQQIEDTIGPGTAFIGDRDSNPLTLVIPAGVTNVNFNYIIQNFFTDTFQAAININTRAINWLNGDLHTNVQTTILDDSSNFTETLLARGRDRDASVGPLAGIAAASLPATFASVAQPSLPAGVLAYSGSGPRVGGANGNGWSAWLKTTYNRASYAGNANNFGFNSQSFNGAAGLDYLHHDWLVGVAAGFGQSNVKQDISRDSANISSARIGAYASYRPGAWTFSGALAANFHSLDTTRLSLLPTPALASYSATTVSAGFETARRFEFGNGTFIEPLGGFIFTHLHTNGFSETGGGGLGITSRGADVAALKGYFGARAGTTFALDNGVTLSPEIRGRVLHDFLNDRRGFTATFITDPTATPFLVSGLQPRPTGALVGAGLTLASGQTWQASLNYDAELRGKDVNHRVRGGVRVQF